MKPNPLHMVADAKKRILKARCELVMQEPFWASLALRLDPQIEEGIGTACTDGQSIAFDPAFVAKLTDRQLNLVIAHEVAHCALLHHARRGQRDPERFNAAADHAVNHMLQRAIDGGATCFDWPTDPVPLKDPAYASLSAEEIYSRLPTSNPNPNADGNPDPGGMGGVKDSPKSVPTAAAEADWKQAVVQAAQAAKMQGKLPGGLESLVQELIAPTVPWQTLLRQFVTRYAKEDWSWMRPNRRFLSQGLYLPSLHSQSLGPLAVAIDTSGSCSGVLGVFLSESQAILDEVRPEKLILMDNDAALAQIREFTPGDLLPRTLKGGGGTDFRPPFKHLAESGEDIACLVFLTDMWGTFPEHEPPFPVLWVSTTDVQPPFGQLARIRED